MGISDKVSSHLMVYVLRLVVQTLARHQTGGYITCQALMKRLITCLRRNAYYKKTGCLYMATQHTSAAGRQWDRGGVPARGELTRERREFNYCVSKKKVAVENFFSMVQNSWKLRIMRTFHRVGSSPVALVFAAGAFLENGKSCI